eukprot:3940583-Rhodomonas_salina.6
MFGKARLPSGSVPRAGSSSSTCAPATLKADAPYVGGADSAGSLLFSAHPSLTYPRQSKRLSMPVSLMDNQS